MRRDNYNTLLDKKYCPIRGYCVDCNTEKCTNFCQRMDTVNYSLSISNIPKTFLNLPQMHIKLIQEDHTREYICNIASNIDRFVGKGMSCYLYGETGTGKTSWAVALLIKYINYCSTVVGGHQLQGLFVNVPKFLLDWKYYLGRNNLSMDELKNDIEKAPIVVWDEIFQTDFTSYESQIIYALVNERINKGLANIYTSNLSPDELKLHDKRLHSRLCIASECLLFSGDDLRAGIDI